MILLAENSVAHLSAVADKLVELYALAPTFFAWLVPALLSLVSALVLFAYWLGTKLEQAGKAHLESENELLATHLKLVKEKHDQVTGELTTLKTQIEELKRRDPRVAGQLDDSIERAQSANSSVTDTIAAAAKYVVGILG
ncbi:hypothetical protein AB7M17_006043 [Bradyrhizobium sp. USDA 377]